MQGTRGKFYKYQTYIDQKFMRKESSQVIYLVGSLTDVSFIMVFYAGTFFLSNKLNLFEKVVAGSSTT